MTVYCLNKPGFFFKGLFVFFGFSLLFLSCKNKEGIGLDLQEPAEGINTIRSDTFSLFTTTVREDSLRTDNLSYNLLGDMNDPLLGKTRSILFTEPRIAVEGIGFNYGLNPVIDSVVLSLKYASPESFYGNINSTQMIKVYQLTQRITPGKEYFSNDNITYDPAEYGSWTGKFNLTDSVGSNPAEAPQLRIRLDTSFARKLINAHQTNNEEFINAIKGFAVVPYDQTQTAGEGATAYLNLKAEETRVTVYFNGNLKHSYPINDKSARINTFTHEYSGSVASDYAGKGGNFDTAFVKSLQGVKLKISIPYLYNLILKDPVAINSAEIVITALDGTYQPPYALPVRLLLVQPDPSGRNSFIFDQLPTESALYGGSLDNNTHQYRFRITRHIQDLLTIYRKTGVDNNRGLYLIMPTDNPVSAARAVIDTRKKSEKKIRLVLTYTIAK